jgi:hypothetical protein
MGTTHALFKRWCGIDDAGATFLPPKLPPRPPPTFKQGKGGITLEELRTKFTTGKGCLDTDEFAWLLNNTLFIYTGAKNHITVKFERGNIKFHSVAKIAQQVKDRRSGTQST